VAHGLRSVRDDQEGIAIDIAALIRERGPLTVARFMEIALYDSHDGYYARAAQRSGRAGDFFTSVDVGAVFGELLAVQVAEMLDLAGGSDVVEAAAGNGRLSADILRAIRARNRSCYDRIRLHLVEVSAEARAQQRETLGDAAERLASSSAELPEAFSGVLFANELLDAMPVHQVVMRPEGLREVFVTAEKDHLATFEGAPSTAALAEYLDRAGVTLEEGWRAEINLNAVEWVREAVRRLERGFLILIDYGHMARELYSVTHAGGTLTTFSRHTNSDAWLERPGEQDITTHVDFTSVQRAAQAEGGDVLALLDQTYFLLGLGAAEMDTADLKTRLALKTLLMPGGLGSTLKVLIVGKGVGRPALRGCSFGVRMT
jgi:SAM-dependent MidA family methyltransferase